MLRKNISKVLLSSSIVIGSTSGYIYTTDEGTRRSIQFWWNIFPIYIHYRFYQFLNRDLKLINDKRSNEMFMNLHDKYTDKVCNLVYKMRGFYLKNAQMMSTQDDFVPLAYMKWVKDTQDNVPSEFQNNEAKEYVVKLLKEESNLDFDDVFSSWEEKPLGVASIGEVHKAILKATGETVAVKILCPNIERRFRGDIKTLKSFCELALPQHAPAFEEIEKQFATEFDYREEGKNLDLIRNLVLPKWSKMVEIPKPYLQYTSKSLLVMEYLDGVKLVDGIRNSYKKLAQLSGKTLEEIEEERKSKVIDGSYQLKTIEQEEANRKAIQNYLFFNDIIVHNSWRFAYNFSVFRLLWGPAEYQWTEQPIDLG